MNTIIVWVMIVTLETHGASVGTSGFVVDNIASRENCRALARIFSEKHAAAGTATCTAVRKVR